MIKVTQKQRDNALHARDVLWPSVPALGVDLNIWSNIEHGEEPTLDSTSCSTLACFGGWCAADPYFKRQGLSLLGLSLLALRKCGGLDKVLFGYCTLFSPEGLGPECGIPGNSNPIDGFTAYRGRDYDHDLVAWRLDWLVKNSEVAA